MRLKLKLKVKELFCFVLGWKTAGCSFGRWTNDFFLEREGRGRGRGVRKCFTRKKEGKKERRRKKERKKKKKERMSVNGMNGEGISSWVHGIDTARHKNFSSTWRSLIEAFDAKGAQCPCCGQRNGFHGGVVVGCHLERELNGVLQFAIAACCKDCNNARTPPKYATKAVLVYDGEVDKSFGELRDHGSPRPGFETIIAASTPTLSPRVVDIPGVAFVGRLEDLPPVPLPKTSREQDEERAAILRAWRTHPKLSHPGLKQQFGFKADVSRIGRIVRGGVEGRLGWVTQRSVGRR